MYNALCEVPAPVRTIDPPGYYDDPTGYARDVKPMRDFVAKHREDKFAEAMWAM